MKLLDVNQLLYAVNRDAPDHRRARAWVESALAGTESVAVSWTVLLAFLRLSTRAAVFPSPLTLVQALDVVDSWLSADIVSVLHPGERHARLEHGAELCSSDTDFARFPGLRWVNPLAPRT